MKLSGLFITLLNMSITASWAVLVIITVRALLKKAPKWIMCSLWALVAVRLLLPFSFESGISLVPSTETVPKTIVNSATPSINSGISAVDRVVNPVIVKAANLSSDPARGMQKIFGILSVVWVVGVAAMLIYALITYLRITVKTRASVEIESGVFICDNISDPFLFGIVRPRIYVPSKLDPNDRVYVIAHERAHLRRKDYLWKPLGFVLLAFHWFNPVMWAAYVLLCRDIEFACDEKVISKFGSEIKKQYSEALVNCSVSKRMVSACPVAFGETSIKVRIKNVLNYKKPTFWAIVACLVVSIVLTACFITDPRKVSASAGGFEKRKERTHEYTALVIKDATCTENGETSYICVRCGESYRAEVRARGHAYESEVTSEAVCNRGEITTYTCKKCGDTYEEEGKPAPDVHDYSVVETLKEATCLEAGENKVTCSRCGDYYTEPTEALGHALTVVERVDAGCMTSGYSNVVCSRCGYSYTEAYDALGHDFAPATCSLPETCTRCGETRGEALGHTHGGICEYCGALIKYEVNNDKLLETIQNSWNAYWEEYWEHNDSGWDPLNQNNRRYGWNDDFTEYYDASGRNIFELYP